MAPSLKPPQSNYSAISGAGKTTEAEQPVVAREPALLARQGHQPLISVAGPQRRAAAVYADNLPRDPVCLWRKQKYSKWRQIIRTAEPLQGVEPSEPAPNLSERLPVACG